MSVDDGLHRDSRALVSAVPKICIPDLMHGRNTRSGPDLRFHWWRGEDLNLRPSGYETYFDRL